MRSAGKVILERTVRSDVPFLPYPEAPPGVYDVFANQHGALSVELDGCGLGLRPGEFTWLEMEPWVAEFWDGDKPR
jgi:hypothetical protein